MSIDKALEFAVASVEWKVIKQMNNVLSGQKKHSMVKFQLNNIFNSFYKKLV